jgi:hypothetical protein
LITGDVEPGNGGSWAVRHVGLLQRSMHVESRSGARSAELPNLEQKKRTLLLNLSSSHPASAPVTQNLCFCITPDHLEPGIRVQYADHEAVYTLI